MSCLAYLLTIQFQHITHELAATDSRPTSCIRYDTISYFYMHSNADGCQLNLPHGTKNNKSSTVAEMGDHLATIDMGRKVEEVLCPF